MSNPVLVEVTRGDIVESEHRGAVAVYDGDGTTLLEIGDVARPVFPRSAVKVIQALPLIETGAADAYGFGEKELALSCASHSGEQAHVALAEAMLKKARLGETALECGSHWPIDHQATVDMAEQRRTPNQLHNNCSGKHAGFICACVHQGIDPRGYVNFGHRYQAILRDVMTEVIGARHGDENHAIDGCSIPTYAVPVRDLAIGFARMATGTGFGAERAGAAKRLFAACMAEPFYVAGTGRADVKLMQAAPGRIFVKTGAEGVYCAAVPEKGVGIALKCDDGAGRAAEAIVAAVLARFFAGEDEVEAGLAAVANPPVPSRKGVTVGVIRPTAALSI
jgi:L-asparaginase II